MTKKNNSGVKNIEKFFIGTIAVEEVLNQIILNYVLTDYHRQFSVKSDLEPSSTGILYFIKTDIYQNQTTELIFYTQLIDENQIDHKNNILL